MDTKLAIQYVRSEGSAIEKARLNYWQYDQPAPPEIVEEFVSPQNQDGGWRPYWSTNYSSVDATCFHLAQANQLGICLGEPAINKAINFIANRQRSDGTWEEEQSVAAIAPPWAKPGDMSAKLYLTANSGYWLAISQMHQEQAELAGRYLANNLDEKDHLSSFLQTQWLSVGLWQAIGLAKLPEQVMHYLEKRLGDFSANNLTWLITTLRTVKISANQMLISEALARLVSLQQKNGQWQSDDGQEFDVHTTLEALFALKLCEQI
jgi:squalene cyclase